MLKVKLKCIDDCGVEYLTTGKVYETVNYIITTMFMTYIVIVVKLFQYQLIIGIITSTVNGRSLANENLFTRIE